MRVRPELAAPGPRLRIEAAVCAVVTRHRFVEIVTRWRGARGVQLAAVRVVRELAIEDARNRARPEYGFGGRQPHPQLATPMLGRPDNRLGRNLGLEDRAERFCRG